MYNLSAVLYEFKEQKVSEKKIYQHNDTLDLYWINNQLFW